VFVLVALGFAAWASDFVTMQGERTVYTVDCTNGAWQGDHCSGQVAAGTRVSTPSAGATLPPRPVVTNPYNVPLLQNAGSLRAVR